MGDPDYLGHLGHLGHFLVDQVGFIRKLNYLDVIRIFNRSHVFKKKTLISDKQVNLGSGECTEPSLV